MNFKRIKPKKHNKDWDSPPDITPLDNEVSDPPKGKADKKRFGMEYLLLSISVNLTPKQIQKMPMRKWWKWYSTESQRDKAIEQLSKKTISSKYRYIFRPIERE